MIKRTLLISVSTSLWTLPEYMFFDPFSEWKTYFYCDRCADETLENLYLNLMDMLHKIKTPIIRFNIREGMCLCTFSKHADPDLKTSPCILFCIKPTFDMHPWLLNQNRALQDAIFDKCSNSSMSAMFAIFQLLTLKEFPDTRGRRKYTIPSDVFRINHVIDYHF